MPYIEVLSLSEIKKAAAIFRQDGFVAIQDALTSKSSTTAKEDIQHWAI